MSLVLYDLYLVLGTFVVAGVRTSVVEWIVLLVVKGVEGVTYLRVYSSETTYVVTLYATFHSNGL